MAENNSNQNPDLYDRNSQQVGEEVEKTRTRFHEVQPLLQLARNTNFFAPGSI